MKRKSTEMDSTSCAAAPETCSGDSSPNDLVAYATAALGTLGTMGLSTILLMQLDGISRRILKPLRLLAKRRQEYKYTVEQSSEFNSLMIRQHIGGGKGVYDPKSESSIWEPYTKNDTKEMEEIIAQILDSKKPTPVIVAMEQDLGDDRDPNTYHLFLAFPPTSSDDSVATPGPPKFYPRRVRVPLVVFSEMLAKAFEGQMTSTALCFVADASSGLGSETLTTVVKKCNHGVATISNPAWMATLALLISKRNIHTITTPQFERIIFSLCRLDAWRVRSSIGTSRTVLFALPGQGCVPLLLPLIQKVFVHERHVFVYDGCSYSVELGTALRKEYGASYRQQAAKEEWEEVSASPKVISATFPMAPIRHNRELPEKLANLNGLQASIVEGWMASVDVFLDMKSNERKNFYTPFVCRMGFLMKRSGIGNGYGSDMSELALKNVLEYVTGSKSRALPTEVMADAVSCLNEMRVKFEDAVQGTKMSAEEKIPIEKCVFTHKSILIGEKTLLDTVQPKEDWSLKAAKKLKSCLCCLPGEGDEEEEDEDEDGGDEDGESSKPKDGMDLSVPGAFATNMNNRSKYVDGKAKFAFDPTMFNK
ncbi:hypothetical protein ACHAXR_010083 [Thalassiosira sp. AJA248-18]